MCYVSLPRPNYTKSEPGAHCPFEIELVIGVRIFIRPNYDKGHAPEHLLPSVTMASRQKSPATDAQQPPGEEEVASGNGEGDEIMEEAEEQEDGYSELFLSSDRCFSPSLYLRAICVRTWTDNGPYSSFIDADINTDMDQLVLFSTRA